jgi:hypothetical protein
MILQRVGRWVLADVTGSVTGIAAPGNETSYPSQDGEVHGTRPVQQDVRSSADFGRDAADRPPFGPALCSPSMLEEAGRMRLTLTNNLTPARAGRLIGCEGAPCD